MTEKEMKKLNRYQLLELLILQSEQVKELQNQVDELQKKLDARDIQMTVVGSIAEASMQLSGIFNTAQKTADIYLDAVKERAEKIEANAKMEADRILQEAKKQARHIVGGTDRRQKMEEILRLCQDGTVDL